MRLRLNIEKGYHEGLATVLLTSQLLRSTLYDQRRWAKLDCRSARRKSRKRCTSFLCVTIVSIFGAFEAVVNHVGYRTKCRYSSRKSKLSPFTVAKNVRENALNNRRVPKIEIWRTRNAFLIPYWINIGSCACDFDVVFCAEGDCFDSKLRPWASRPSCTF